jgi:hypothetical protein
MFLNENIKIEIFKKLTDIINIKDEKWNSLDQVIKIKIIHHFCNFISKIDDSGKKLFDFNTITIPLKSNKPKKIIEFSGINKNFNFKLFQEFNNTILDYTFQFRNKYNVNSKNKIYYTYNNLPKNDYYQILNSINSIVYNFITKYKKYININKFYRNIIGSNEQKLITDTVIPKDFTINMENNIIYIKFLDNLNVKLELFYTSDKITKNIPVKYNIKIYNHL